MKRRTKILIIGLPLLVLIGAWSGRRLWSRLAPIRHTGKVARISQFNKGGFRRSAEGTRQLTQFALIFSDGFQCEGYDTSFAAVREGDIITIHAYHDVKGYPLLDPEWWECDEAQLIELASPTHDPR